MLGGDKIETVIYNEREYHLECCPFCGGSPAISESGVDFQIYCKNCGVMTYDEEEERAVEHWNRRAAGPAQEHPTEPAETDVCDNCDIYRAALFPLGKKCVECAMFDRSGEFVKSVGQGPQKDSEEAREYEKHYPFRVIKQVNSGDLYLGVKIEGNPIEWLQKNAHKVMWTADHPEQFQYKSCSTCGNSSCHPDDRVFCREHGFKYWKQRTCENCGWGSKKNRNYDGSKVCYNPNLANPQATCRENDYEHWMGSVEKG